MILACLAFLLMVGADGAQLPAGPVRQFGGKSRLGDTVSLLDLGDGAVPSRVIQFPWRRPSAAKIIVLDRAPKVLEELGLARPNDGTFWVLANKGRSVARFDEKTGKFLQLDDLLQPSEGIWDFGSRVVLALMQLHGDEPLLAVGEGRGFRSFTGLKSRKRGSTIEILAGNLFDCGFAESSRLPCWWSNGAPEAVLIGEDEAVSVSPLPSLIDNRLLATSSNPSPTAEAMIMGLPYPIRDVFLLPAGSLWVLTNQEGDRPVTEPGAVRSRHVIRVQAGKKAKTVELPKPGLAILGGDEGGLLLLYRDGSIGWLNCR